MNKSIRVLIVEDSEDDTLLIIEELKSGGYDPTFERVETYEAMEAALDKGGWDLIISDYVMPHLSGLASLQLMQKKKIDLPFIVVSGAIGEDVAVNMMKEGAHDYLMKGNLTRLSVAIEREMSKVKDRAKSRQAEKELEKYRKHLETLVEEQTAELAKANAIFEEKNKKHDNLNELFIGREFKINELRERVKALEGRLVEKREDRRLDIGD